MKIQFYFLLWPKAKTNITKSSLDLRSDTDRQSVFYWLIPFHQVSLHQTFSWVNDHTCNRGDEGTNPVRAGTLVDLSFSMINSDSYYSELTWQSLSFTFMTSITAWFVRCHWIWSINRYTIALYRRCTSEILIRAYILRDNNVLPSIRLTVM